MALESRFDYTHRLRFEEVQTILMVAVLNLLIIMFSDISKAPDIFFLNIGIAALTFAVYLIHSASPNKYLSTFRDWYVLLMLISVYMEHNHLIPIIHPHDVDARLIALDRMLFFGHDPTVFLERFTFPVLTELLEIVYVSYYLLPFILCVMVYIKNDRTDFHIITSTLLMGFYISYLGYYLFPAIGPQYTLGQLQAFPLKGILAFDYLRAGLASIEGVTRDCCPSGHTLISMLATMLAYRYYRPYFRISLVWTILMVISTVYLRYHYVTDDIAGVVIALFVYRWAPGLARYYIFGNLRQKGKLPVKGGVRSLPD